MSEKLVGYLSLVFESHPSMLPKQEVSLLLVS